METTTNSGTEPLMLSRASYVNNLLCTNDKLRSFRSCLSGLLISLSPLEHLRPYRLPLRPHRYPYSSRLRHDGSILPHLRFFYLCPFTFVSCYDLRQFLFLDKLVGESERLLMASQHSLLER
ncbi:hypothetical protein C4D60_Mb09t26080 [Musa balbisiana]|uniref:Uncharacterized protein n=1 Tax=Musa balbisiana TaxID=52838 RepID=A0A4S8ILM1_MUSBA|nr:hypothetical protein C4D60_Mb09t26080 [Musa balbisiana]